MNLLKIFEMKIFEIKNRIAISNITIIVFIFYKFFFFVRRVSS